MIRRYQFALSALAARGLSADDLRAVPGAVVEEAGAVVLVTFPDAELGDAFDAALPVSPDVAEWVAP